MWSPSDIRAALSGSLPGHLAHNRVMSYPRSTAFEARMLQPPPKESAVLFLLFPKEDRLHTLFIERPANQGTHSGQLAFPGGRLEAGEDHRTAAIRESQEEVGLDPGQVEILGSLSPLYIPPSHFVVQPFVGYLEQEYPWNINPSEVVRVLPFPIERLLSSDSLTVQSVSLQAGGRSVEVQGYAIENRFIWGATAMMVHEFVEVMRG
jgi:8-oxo-dGTP pyrophosphatase MutT (NUDIX family)